MTYLQDHAIPFILLTNGGGKREAERVSEISRLLGLSKPLGVKNFVQSHTPFAGFLTPSLNGSSPQSLTGSSTILVVGGEGAKCRDVAENYGFQNVVTPGDIYTAHPEVWPFSHVFNSYYSRFAVPLSRSINPENPASSLKIDAIFVFNDPRDWALDSQLILDILLSRSGILGTTSSKNGDRTLPNKGFQQDDQPPLYFSNPDLLWAAGYHIPRLGQGGFRHALEGIWQRLTDGARLQSTTIGKPSGLTYAFAEKTLHTSERDVKHDPNCDLELNDASHDLDVRESQGLRKVYMIGDNPESDIMGANTFQSSRGTQWVSILVNTGVYTEEVKGRYDMVARPELKPRFVADDVRAAVNRALKDSQWEGRI